MGDEQFIFMNEPEIYLATMDVVRRMQVIAEVLRLRGADLNTDFVPVRNAMKTFLDSVTAPLLHYSEENKRFFKSPPSQPYDDNC